MPIIRQQWIRREDLRINRERLYVFGDNIAEQGFGGQAKEMRGEPNAVGVPTKWAPDNDPDSFFRDSDMGWVLPVIIRAFSRIDYHLRCGGEVVIPVDGLGTGLADLPRRAPLIAKLIDVKLSELESRYGRVVAERSI
jgi:hypothetical protein